MTTLRTAWYRWIAPLALIAAVVLLVMAVTR